MPNASILVIDDDPKVVKSLELILPEYSLHSEVDGEKGLRFLGKPNQIDLVILDVKMNGMGGIEVLKKIRTLNERLSVIILTAFGTKDVAIQALQAHADDFVEKPDIVHIRQKIDRLLNLRDQDPRNRLAADSTQRVVRFVERNYEKCLTLEDAAKVAYLSPKYLSRLFKNKVGKNFKEFVIDLKMRRAKELLCQSSYNVNEISDRLGYKNSESFMKIFKKTQKCTPSQYRESHQEKNFSV